MAEELGQQVQRFLEGVNATLAAVLGSDDQRLRLAAVDDGFVIETTDTKGILLTGDGKPMLRLHVEFACAIDGHGDYLAVERSEAHVFSVASNEPLFRYEFIRSPVGGTPSAHLHVHAHRDAFTQALLSDGTRTKRAKQRVPVGASLARMLDVHYPLGGPRMRPALEDVLQMLVEEFGIDAVDDWRSRIDASRRDWRVTQVKTVVRDAPRAAAETLRALGYEIDLEQFDQTVRDGLLRF